MKKYIWYNFQKIHCLEINGKQKNSISKRRNTQILDKEDRDKFVQEQEMAKNYVIYQKKYEKNIFWVYIWGVYLGCI